MQVAKRLACKDSLPGTAAAATAARVAAAAAADASTMARYSIKSGSVQQRTRLQIDHFTKQSPMCSQSNTQ